MSRPCLLSVLLCALLPFQGLAQAPSQPPMVPAPATPAEGPRAALGEEQQPQDEIIPRERQRPEDSVGRRVGRIALGTFGGLLGGVVGGLPGIGLSIGLERGCEGCANGTAVIIAGLAGVAGVASGMAFGVWGIGSLLGGEGRYLPTLAGTGIGLLVGGGIAVYLGDQIKEELAIPPLLIGPILGTLIAYEISHSNEWERGAEASPSVAVLPTVGVSPSGGFVAGLVGRF